MNWLLWICVIPVRYKHPKVMNLIPRSGLKGPQLGLKPQNWHSVSNPNIENHLPCQRGLCIMIFSAVRQWNPSFSLITPISCSGSLSSSPRIQRAIPQALKAIPKYDMCFSTTGRHCFCAVWLPSWCFGYYLRTQLRLNPVGLSPQQVECMWLANLCVSIHC